MNSISERRRSLGLNKVTLAKRAGVTVKALDRLEDNKLGVASDDRTAVLGALVREETIAIGAAAVIVGRRRRSTDPR